MIRLHVEASLSPGARVVLPPEQARYLSTVMRRGVGDAVALFNGRDGEWRALLADTGKRGGVTLAVVEPRRPQATGPDLELVVAAVKKARLETIVEKAAELGVQRVRLAVTRRTNLEHLRLERLHAIAVEASEQTGRLDVPEIVGPEKLETILDGWEAGRRLMVCDEGEGFDGGDASAGPLPMPSDGLAGLPRGDPWAVLVGPEGGWAPEERARLRAMEGAVAVSLGPRILRADTAAIAALTLWQAALGDWRVTP